MYMGDYVEISAKTVEDAVTEALIKLQTTSDKLEYEVIEAGSTGMLGFIGKKPAIIKARKKFDLVDYTYDFLNDMFKAMGIEVKSDINYDAEARNMDISFAGDEMGILIGKRGQTLDSLQYIISLVVNKESEAYAKELVKNAKDTFNEYRGRMFLFQREKADMSYTKASKKRKEQFLPIKYRLFPSDIELKYGISSLNYDYNNIAKII